MNPELAHILSETRRQDLLRAARCEHHLEVTRSWRSRTSRSPRKARLNGAWRALAVRRPAIGKA
jgi:hypothetical protein